MAAKTAGKKPGPAQVKPGGWEDRELLSIPLNDLPPNRHQPRRHRSLEALKDLANSIQRYGLLNPIHVSGRQDGGYRIVAGHRRVEACSILGWSEIPAFLVDGDEAELALIENIHREDLHPLDEAIAFRSLIDLHGYTQGKLAKLLAKSRSSINESLRLLDLPEEIWDACRTSDTPKSVLLEIARYETPTERKAAWEAAVAEGQTVREARRQKKSARRASPPASPTKGALRKARALFDALEDVSPEEAEFPELRETVERVCRFLRELGQGR